MDYRREIDGLRAVAVVPVILFHAGSDLFRGGFVGVDVFFVISGFLITTILLDDLSAGRFSLIGFYERRARRILPALFVVVAASVPFAWAFMLPEQFRDFGESVVAVTLFSSNVLFWQEAGYFAPAAELKPLLHTWSLAVEEQFYILFPLVLLAAFRLGRRRLLLLLALAFLASLALAEVGGRVKPTAAFYLAPTRAFELLAGSLCAVLVHGRPRRIDGRLAALGLALVLGSMLLFDARTQLPGLLSLVPVAGTALVVVHAGEGTAVGRLLSARPLVGIGLVSYGAYLWHQPLLAFARIRLDDPPQGLMLALAALSLLLGWATWRWVERPFRARPSPVVPSRRAAFAAAAGAGAVAVVAGALATRLPPLVEMREPALFRPYALEPVPTRPCDGFEAVRTGDATCTVLGDGPVRVLVWGDSHAGALAAGIRPPEGVEVAVLSVSGCPPAAGARRIDVDDTSVNCRDAEVLDRYLDWLSAEAFDEVVLVARWTAYLRGWHMRDRPQPATWFLADAETDRPDAADSAEALLRGVSRVAGVLGDRAPVLVVSQAPDMQSIGENARARLAGVPAARVREWHAVERSFLEELASSTGADVLDSSALFCDDATCALRRDGHLVYSDDNHLGPYAAGLQWAMVESALADRVQRRAAVTP